MSLQQRLDKKERSQNILFAKVELSFYKEQMSLKLSTEKSQQLICQAKHLLN